jgi:hypothetical protein
VRKLSFHINEHKSHAEEWKIIFEADHFDCFYAVRNNYWMSGVVDGNWEGGVLLGEDMAHLNREFS